MNYSKVNLLWVAKSSMPRGNSVKTHKHDYYHLLFVFKGGAHFTIDGIEYAVGEKEGFFVPPHYSHSYKNDLSEALIYYEVKFSVLSPAMEEALSKVEPHIKNDEFIWLLIKQIVDECSDLSALSDSSLTSYLLSFIYYVTRSNRQDGKNGCRYIDVSDYNRLSREIIRYLEENYMNDVSLDDVAGAVGLNKNYICGAFKKDTHFTIGDCLTLIRVRKAAELISYSELSLTQIAALTGYVNASHFNRVFLKYVGIPPGHYRKMYPLNIVNCDAGNLHKPYEKPEDLFAVSVLGKKKITREMIKAFEKNITEDDED